MKWKVILTAALLAAGGATYAMSYEPPQMMEYRVTAQPGDTVWSICRRIATDRDDLSKVVWQAMRDSHIERASDLQPGQEVRVKVRAIE